MHISKGILKNLREFH